MNVPPDVKAYDTLKVGDRVDVDYHESIGRLDGAGRDEARHDREVGRTRRWARGAPATAARETQISAEVVSRRRRRTTRSPSRDRRVRPQTMTVADPAMQKKLPNLKPGQVVQFTYTEAMAVGIRPAPVK